MAWRKPKLVKTILAIACVFVLALPEQSYAAGNKQFSDYPVRDFFSGKTSVPDAKTAPAQWSAVRKIEKDIIREEMTRGANFAGAYNLATVGCGSTCEAIFIIDLRNGRVFAAPETASNGAFFQKDSRLIILKENRDYGQPRRFLVFENSAFRQPN